MNITKINNIKPATAEELKDIELGSNKDFYDDDWALSDILSEGEIVISDTHLRLLTNDVEDKLHRAKYYNDKLDMIRVLDNILDDLKFIRMGARP